jgi:hypothetical protein
MCRSFTTNETNASSNLTLEKHLNSDIRKIQAFFQHLDIFEQMMQVNNLKGTRIEHENGTTSSEK